jgi:(R)-2-hydroxyacyl-CoA dehydratese activating ATPase
MAYYAGIDIGSLTCDVVILDDARCLLASEIVLTGARARATTERALASALARAGLTREQVTSLVSTGYGREGVVGRARAVTEITCHARGAFHLLPQTRLVLDVGGQDCKAIALDDRGRVADFAMNDKCAAGTGRFFEMMAHALEVDLDDFGALALRAARRVPISSVCTVFAESEVVSLVAEGEPVENILGGLCRAAAERVSKLARQVGVAEPVTLTGGVAKNAGFRGALEELLGVKTEVPAEPQLVGALGAALLAASGETV